MWTYTAYGLDIRSALPLPELAARPGAPSTAVSGPTSGLEATDQAGESGEDLTDEVVIRIDPRVALHDVARDTPMTGHVADGAAVLCWPHVGTFAMRAGREIAVAPERDVNDAAFRVYLLGPSFGVLLHQRGWLALTASTVLIGGRAFTLLGSADVGRSATTDAFRLRGHTVVTDDITVIAISELIPATVMPPSHRLGTAHTTATPTQLVRGIYRAPRPRAPLVSADPLEPIPLGGIYVISKGNALRIQSLSSAIALTEVAAHAYGARLLANVQCERDFAQYRRLADTVPVRRLVRPWLLDRPADVVRAVEEDAARLG